MVRAGRTEKAKGRAILGMLCVMVVGLQSFNVAGATTLRHAKNLSFPSQCAEEDNRTEERRVGKECRSRWSPYH